MSLTGQLADKTSPVARWMEEHTDRRACAHLIREVNDQLAARPPLVRDTEAPQMVGRAFDYGFRWLLGPLEARVAVAGAALCERLGWADAATVVRDIIQMGNTATDERIRARCALALAWFEHVYRLGEPPADLAPFLGRRASRDTALALGGGVPPGSVEDVVALLATVTAVWGDDLQRPLVLNPTFAGSGDVGGADADWIVADTLYDCKCSWRPRPFARDHLLQSLGYVLLDYDDAYGIRRMGWYFPRQRTRVVYSLDQLLHRTCRGANLIQLRASFRAVLTPAVAHKGIMGGGER